MLKRYNYLVEFWETRCGKGSPPSAPGTRSYKQCTRANSESRALYPKLIEMKRSSDLAQYGDKANLTNTDIKECKDKQKGYSTAAFQKDYKNCLYERRIKNGQSSSFDPNMYSH